MSALDISAQVAYFSMEIALELELPTYSGGLGVLAGDVLRAAADLEVPMVGVTLAHRKGYVQQRLDPQGNQLEAPMPWQPENRLLPAPATVTLRLEGAPVIVRAWEYAITGYTGHRVPVLLLDTALPENRPDHQRITNALYGGDARYRLLQEAVLGLGGFALLQALGYSDLHKYHMNEGHSALLPLGLLQEVRESHALGAITAADLAAVRRRCVFTTHTPVPAGHDRFPMTLAHAVLPEPEYTLLTDSACCPGDTLDMTDLGLAMSGYVNGVSQRHQVVSQGMYPDAAIGAVTNGVHAATWAAPPIAALFDHRLPGWRRDNRYLRNAFELPLGEISTAHSEAKQQLLTLVQQETGVRLLPDVFTIGFARRATPYKRHSLLFTDIPRLKRIAEHVGPMQVLFSGKAHPADAGGKDAIRAVFAAAEALQGTISVTYLEDYDVRLAAALVAGVDLWLNTPQKPLEASGTSGMKAAINGVPSLSVLDGWWLEGHVEGVAGWAIGDRAPISDDTTEAADLYRKLETAILPLYYGDAEGYAEVMRSTIALNGSFFNAQRMLAQYVLNAYNHLSREAIPAG